MEREPLNSWDPVGGNGSKRFQRKFRNRVPTEVTDTLCLKKNYLDSGLNKRFYLWLKI